MNTFLRRSGLLLTASLLFSMSFGTHAAQAAPATTCAEFPIAVGFSNFTGNNVGTATVSLPNGAPTFSPADSITLYQLRWKEVSTGTLYSNSSKVSSTGSGPYSFTIDSGKLKKENKTYQFFLDPFVDSSTRADASCVGTTASQVNMTSTKLAVTTSASSSVASGATLSTQPVVAIRNDSNSTVTDDLTQVKVSISGGDGNGTIIGTSTVTPVSGVATFSGLGISGTNGESYTLTFTAGALTSASQSGIAVSTGTAVSISISDGDAQSASARSQVATAPVVIVRDSGGNPVSGFSVTYAVATGGGSISGASVSTNASGLAAVGSWTLGTAGGSNTLTATATGLTGSPVTFSATGTFRAQFNNNRGSGSESLINAAPGTLITLPAGSSMSRSVGGSSLTILGWNTSPFGTGSQYGLSTQMTMPSRNVTLYAEWGGTLTFDGQGANAETVPGPVSQRAGNVILPAAPTRPGKTFVGWNTRPNGRGSNFSAGATFYLGNLKVILYAKWS